MHKLGHEKIRNIGNLKNSQKIEISGEIRDICNTGKNISFLSVQLLLTLAKHLIESHFHLHSLSDALNASISKIG